MLSLAVSLLLCGGGCSSDSGPSNSPHVVRPGSIADGQGNWKYVPAAGDNDLCAECIEGEPCVPVPCEEHVLDLCDFDTLADLVAIGTITTVHESILGCENSFFVFDVEIHATVGGSTPAHIRITGSQPGNPPRPDVGQARLFSLRDVDDTWYSIQSIPIVPESDEAYSTTPADTSAVDLPTDYEALYREVAEDLESYHAGSPDGPCGVRSQPYSEGDDRVRAWFEGCGLEQ